MTTLELDRFAGIDSPLRRWDPRWKLAAGGVFILALMLLRHPAPAAAGLAVAAALAAVGRLPPQALAARLAPPALLVVLVAIVLALTGGGETLKLGPLALSVPGARRGIRIVIKVFAILVTLLAVTATSPATRTFTALQSLGLPSSLVLVLHLTYRYLFLLRAESHDIRTAMRARGFLPRCDRRTMTLTGQAVGMLLIRSLERADRVYLAMRARGFDGRFRAGPDRPARPSDVAGLALLAAAGTLLVALDRLN